MNNPVVPTNYALVLSSTGQALMPCHPARARELLTKGKAAVYKRYPFTIILKHRKNGDLNPTSLKIDPGSKITGVAATVTGQRGERCVMGLHLTHRGQVIKHNLMKRAACRRNRRRRNTRYRPARFLNRTKAIGWLPPSIFHRVQTTLTWVKRLVLALPVSKIEIESVSFDSQKMLDKQIKGKEYQRGTLLGYKIREYLLFRYNHTCQYCSGVSKDPILEMEHIHPKSKGGVDTISNLTLSCKTCNRAKDNMLLPQWELFLYGKGDALAAARRKGIRRVMKGIRPPMLDAAAVNATRNRLVNEIREIGLLTLDRPSYLTKYNRQRQGYNKDHFVDAAVLGGISDTVYIPKGMCPLKIKATGHGSRQMCRPDKHGFPRTSAKGPSKVFGFKTGDIVHATVLTGKYVGVYTGRVAVRLSGRFALTHHAGQFGVPYHYCTPLHRNDGYHYLK